MAKRGSSKNEKEEVTEDEESNVDEDRGRVEAGRLTVGRRPVREPTKAEKEDHERTHCPYRSWCKHCVKSRARNSPHRDSAPEEPLEEIKVPRVHMDYFFMSREDEEASTNPLLVVADERSGARCARAAGHKRSRRGWIDGLADKGREQNHQVLGPCGRSRK